MIKTSPHLHDSTHNAGNAVASWQVLNDCTVAIDPKNKYQAKETYPFDIMQPGKPKFSLMVQKNPQLVLFSSILFLELCSPPGHL